VFDEGTLKMNVLKSPLYLLERLICEGSSNSSGTGATEAVTYSGTRTGWTQPEAGMGGDAISADRRAGR
jgi:hypothetical protein